MTEFIPHSVMLETVFSATDTIWKGEPIRIGGSRIVGDVNYWEVRTEDGRIIRDVHENKLGAAP